MINVGIDCDGVLADFDLLCAQVLFEVTGRLVDFKKRKSWSSRHLVPEWAEDAFDEKLREPGRAAGIEPLPGAKRGITQLKEIANVYVITSPLNDGPFWPYERTCWLEKHFGISRDNVIQASSKAKHLVSLSVLVEDKASTLDRWFAHHDPSADVHAVLWRTHFNFDTSSAHPRYSITDDWNDVVSLVRRIGEKH